MGKGNLWGLMYLTLMIILMEESSALHLVGGGRFTWNPNINLSDWATHEHFYSGEWLYFGFDPTTHNVLEVNKTSYEQCIDTNFITNVTHGGRDVFQLREAKTYYFICGRGYCDRGMKLAVKVLPQPTPSTLTVTMHSTATTLLHSTAFAVVAMAILTFAFKT